MGTLRQQSARSVLRDHAARARETQNVRTDLASVCGRCGGGATAWSRGGGVMPFDGIRRAFRIPLFTKRQLEREVDDEIAFHLAQRAERLKAQGMSADAAIAEARRLFGDPTTVRDECVDVDQIELRRNRLMMFIDDVRGDARFAWRSLRRAPGFTLTARVTLVVGIAALTSIFSYMNAVYFAPLPYHDANRMVAVSQQLANQRFFQFSSVAPEVVPFVRQA